MASSDQHWALLGGTFDPVHIGHLRTAISLIEHGFNEVHLIPNAQPPHKQAPLLSQEQRKTMLELSLRSHKNIHLNPIELESDEQSYSINTLKKMRTAQNNTHHLTWVLGMDAWLGLPHWYQADDLLNYANLLVINRPQQDKQLSDWHHHKLDTHQCEFKQLLASKYNKIAFLNLPQLDVSSSQIKEKLKHGHSIRYLVADDVLNFIQQQELYKT